MLNGEIILGDNIMPDREIKSSPVDRTDDRSCGYFTGCATGGAIWCKYHGKVWGALDIFYSSSIYGSMVIALF